MVKNSLLTNEKTITRKFKEWVLALKLERVLSKEEILAMYLNESPYGGNVYGIEEAGERYFAKHAADLSLAESAYLAALPQAPTYYSPYGNHKDALEERKNLVLQKMLEYGFISQDEFESAAKEEVTFVPAQDRGIRAPHFVFYVREYLENKYGKEAVEGGGLKVTTTIDYDLQAKAEEVVARFAVENEKKFNASNAGMVAIDTRTGQILTMVGSRDYFDTSIDGNYNIALAHRQPGSSFKPFVYAEAIQKGYTPDTIVFDLKTQFSTACRPDDLSKEPPCFSPDNYDNVFRGPVSFREALAQSLNIPSVKVLYLAGISESLRLAKDMGITTLGDAARYGLTLVLGGGEVTLLDMTGAYATFANEGIRNTPVGILKIEDSNGGVLEEYQNHSERVLPENTARTISDLLSDNGARTPAFGESSYLYFPGHDVAAKTGTTNNYRDAWILGYTPSIAVGAWAGNNDNSPMEKKVAGFIVAPMWNAFMQDVVATAPNEVFTKPEYDDPTTLKPILKGLWQGGQEYTVDSLSGKLATDYTPQELRQTKVVGEVHDILYYVDKDNPRGPLPANPQNDPQFAYWEYPVQLWKSAQGISATNAQSIPTSYDDLHRPEYAPLITIMSPTPTASYRPDSRITVQIASQGKFALTKVDYFVNGELVGSSQKSPFSLSFSPNLVKNIATANTLRAVAHDAFSNSAAVDTVFHLRGLE